MGPKFGLKENLQKYMILFVLMGLVYLNVEVVVRAIKGDLVRAGFNNLKYFSFAGWTSIWMFFIGGFAGVCIGLVNEIDNKKVSKMPMWIRVIACVLFIYVLEYLTGTVFNRMLKLNIWDYSNYPLNIKGQITLLYIPLWGLLVPFASWLDDLFKYYVFYDSEPSAKPKKVTSYYKDLFTGK